MRVALTRARSTSATLLVERAQRRRVACEHKLKMTVRHFQEAPAFWKNDGHKKNEETLKNKRRKEELRNEKSRSLSITCE
jgi:hypothetical protein